MSEFFDKILRCRGIKTAPLPLWKLEITDEEYTELKSTLSRLRSCDFWNYGKEFALFYAECWRREYYGGAPSKDFMTEKMGFPHSYTKEIFEYARKALSALHIPILQNSSKNFFFRTLLLQGGLPMAYVQHKDGFNKFKEFLKSLLKKTSRLEIDWENTEIIKDFPCVNLLPESYRNDNIYAVSLQIVRAIEEERDDLLPYKSEAVELKELTKSLKDEREKIRKHSVTHPLSINWVLSIPNDSSCSKGEFSYALDNIKTIYSNMISGLEAQNCFQFDIFVSQQYVATYKKVKYDEDNNVAIYKRINSDNKKFIWHGENVIEVKVVSDCCKPLFPQVVDCYAPNLSVPQIFQKSSLGYIQHDDVQSSDCIALLPQEWVTDDSIETTNLSINGEILKLVPSSELTGKDDISIKNSVTNETMQLACKTSIYSVSYGGVYLHWLEKANFILLEKKPFIKIYDSDGNSYNPKNVLVQENGNNEWKPFNLHTTLKTGIVNIKVKCPDDSEDIRKFYFIGDLKFEDEKATSTEAYIKCNLNWGTILPIKEDSLSYTEISRTIYSTKWKVERTPSSSKFPTTCSFEISNHNNPDLRISIPAPYEGLCLVKKDEIVPDGAIISINDFSSYSVISSGNKTNKMEIGYTSATSSTADKTIEIEIKNSITPLSNYEESINRIFLANGFGTFDRKAAATLRFGKNSYKIRHFVLDTQANEPSNSIEVHTLDKNASFVFELGNLFACKIEEPSSENHPSVISLEKLESGHYIFPSESPDGNYVIFSGIYDKQRIVPKLYTILNGQITDATIDSRSADAQNNKVSWRAELENESIQNSSAWDKVPVYIEIADKYRIPFRTFNAITMAVSTPQLTTRLLACLFWNNKTDSMLPALLRMEQELAIAFHWNRKDIIGQEVFNLISQLPPAISDSFLPLFIEFFKNVMAITLDEDVATELAKALAGSLPNNNLDVIQLDAINAYKAQAIGKNPTNSDLPVVELPLKYGYYAKIKMKDYQKTLIHAPLFVYEYIQGWNDSLWESSPEGINRRRVINFYRQYYKPTYYKILMDMLR